MRDSVAHKGWGCAVVTSSSISILIQEAESGDGVAACRLFDVLYSELHHLAKRQLMRHGVPVSLSTTTLLHEAYLDMAGQDHLFPDEGRFGGARA